MEKHEIIWLAGLLEGEGCFNYRADRKQARISVEMTDQDVLERVAGLFGTKVSVRPPRILGPCTSCRKREIDCPLPMWNARGLITVGYAISRGCRVSKQSYQTAIHGKRAENLMRLIYPFMGTRRSEKIAEILGSVV